MSGLLSLSGTKAANDLKVNVVNTSNINLHETRSVKKSSETEPQKLREDSKKKTRTLIFPLMILLN